MTEFTAPGLRWWDIPLLKRWPLDGFGGLRMQSKVKYSSGDGLEALVGFLGLQLGHPAVNFSFPKLRVECFLPPHKRLN